jgi:RNA polymerase sigma-70 factor (ECF subfamily)
MRKNVSIADVPGVQCYDEEIFRDIYNEYYTRLCFFASKLLPDCPESDDIVQEVFVKLWTRWNDLYNPDSIKAFLYISVKNSCLNSHKHKKIVQKYHKLNNRDITEDSVASHILEAEVLESVYSKVQSMPEGCRSVMQLSYFQGMKDKEIAEHLKISVNTVKTQKKRGLSLLRVAFKLTVLLGAFLSAHSE